MDVQRGDNDYGAITQITIRGVTVPIKKPGHGTSATDAVSLMIAAIEKVDEHVRDLVALPVQRFAQLNFFFVEEESAASTKEKKMAFAAAASTDKKKKKAGAASTKRKKKKKAAAASSDDKNKAAATSTKETETVPMEEKESPGLIIIVKAAHPTVGDPFYASYTRVSNTRYFVGEFWFQSSYFMHIL